MSGAGRQALQDMRRLLGLLRDGAECGEGGTDRPHQLDADALAPQPGLGELVALADRVRSTGLVVRLDNFGEPFALSAAAELTVYRIVQEALTNTLKHAASVHSVHITLAFDDPDVTVRIVDDGLPPVPAGRGGIPSLGPGAPGGGHGVLGMKERAAAFDGTLVAGPRDEGGWQVVALLHTCKAPLPA